MTKRASTACWPTMPRCGRGREGTSFKKGRVDPAGSPGSRPPLLKGAQDESPRDLPPHRPRPGPPENPQHPSGFSAPPSGFHPRRMGCGPQSACLPSRFPPIPRRRHQHRAIQDSGFLFAPGFGDFNEDSSFHAARYLESHWARWFERRAHLAHGMAGYQDLSVWQKGATGAFSRVIK